MSDSRTSPTPLDAAKISLIMDFPGEGHFHIARFEHRFISGPDSFGATVFIIRRTAQSATWADIMATWQVAPEDQDGRLPRKASFFEWLSDDWNKEPAQRTYSKSLRVDRSFQIDGREGYKPWGGVALPCHARFDNDSAPKELTVLVDGWAFLEDANVSLTDSQTTAPTQ